VQLTNGCVYGCDLVLSATGVRPNSELWANVCKVCFCEISFYFIYFRQIQMTMVYVLMINFVQVYKMFTPLVTCVRQIGHYLNVGFRFVFNINILFFIIHIILYYICITHAFMDASTSNGRILCSLYVHTRERYTRTCTNGYML
jgi:hypothetical protein